MEGVVGRGTLLAGRYRVLQPLGSDLVGASAWVASDQILDRPVRATILSSGNVSQALDAARRAALVTDPRLVRVLDVGEHDGIAYVVTEQVTGPSLVELAAHGPLPAEQARALVGEAAAALEVARRRGVHHLALRPSVLHLTADARVLLTGLALDGALVGQGLGDARSTTRADTVGLVRLLYAALTGRWPAPPGEVVAEGARTLPPAPVVSGAPVAPADLVAGVPNDLDTLCAVTLGVHDDGPNSPGELVRELEPWGQIAAGDVLARVGTRTDSTGPQPAVPGGATGPGAVVGGAVVAAAGAGDAVGAPRPAGPGAAGAAPPAVQRQSVKATVSGQQVAGSNLPGTPPPAVPRAAGFGGPGHPAAVGTAGAAAAAAGAAAVEAGAGRGMGDPATNGAPTVPVAPKPAVTRTPTGRTAATTRMSTPPAAPPAGTQPQAPLIPALGGPPPPVPPAADFDEVVGGHHPSIATRRFDPTRLVLVLVVLAVIAGVVIAAQALFRPVESGTQEEPRTQPTSGSSATAGTPGTSPSPTPSAPAAAGPPVIASATSIDPSDTDGEHEEAVARAFDGDPATAWYTLTYNRPDFAGFKDAVGYAITLTAESTVSAVTLQVNGTGGNVEIRATTAADPTGGPVLASGALGPDVTYTFEEPVQTSSLVLWFTALAQTSDGSNRIELAEITLS